MRKNLLSLLLLLVQFSISSSISGINNHQEYETITGVVIAYDRVSSFDKPHCTRKLYLIIRTDASDANIKHPRHVKILYLDSEKGFEELIRTKKSWRFKMTRNLNCDLPIREFPPVTLIGRNSSDSNLRIWKLVAGAEKEKIPYGETLPCYALKFGDFKLYKK